MWCTPAICSPNAVKKVEVGGQLSQGIDMWILPCGSGFPNLQDQEEELSTTKPQKNLLKKSQTNNIYIKHKHHKINTKDKTNKLKKSKESNVSLNIFSANANGKERS